MISFANSLRDIRQSTNCRGSVLTELALSLPLFFIMIPAITAVATEHETGQAYIGAARLAAKEVSDASQLDASIPCRNLEMIAETETRLQLTITESRLQTQAKASIYMTKHEIRLPQLPGQDAAVETAVAENYFLRITLESSTDDGILGSWRAVNNLSNRRVSLTYPLAGGCDAA